MSDVARYYDESKQDNPNNPASIPGVPLADLDPATFDALPEHLQTAVDASPLYRKTRPAEPKTQKRTVADDDPTKQADSQ